MVRKWVVRILPVALVLMIGSTATVLAQNVPKAKEFRIERSILQITPIKRS